LIKETKKNDIKEDMSEQNRDAIVVTLWCNEELDVSITDTAAK
jgi:hypothetical protein